jgi:hypothetical protein
MSHDDVPHEESVFRNLEESVFHHDVKESVFHHDVEKSVFHHDVEKSVFRDVEKTVFRNVYPVPREEDVSHCAEVDDDLDCNIEDVDDEILDEEDVEDAYLPMPKNGQFAYI